MLSILIPVYNWSIQNLVEEIHRQSVDLDIPFEILAVDDCSSNKTIVESNSEIRFEEFRLIRLEENVGNAEARNILARTARFSWLLFLDADMLPVRPDFISQYVAQLAEGDFDVMSGGILYRDEVSDACRLKWLHGKQTEEHCDGKDPFLEIRGNNFLIRKELFLRNLFGGLPEKYGYVDTHFGLKLKMEGARVKIISNPCWHLGLETNHRFVEKYKTSLRNARWLMMNQPEIAENLRIIKSYRLIEKIGLPSVLSLFYRFFHPVLLKNLYSKHPSLFVFQLFKLAYFCSLPENK